MSSLTRFFTFTPLLSLCMRGLWSVRPPENPREDGLIPVVPTQAALQAEPAGQVEDLSVGQIQDRNQGQGGTGPSQRAS